MSAAWPRTSSTKENTLLKHGGGPLNDLYKIVDGFNLALTKPERAPNLTTPFKFAHRTVGVGDGLDNSHRTWLGMTGLDLTTDQYLDIPVLTRTQSTEKRDSVVTEQQDQTLTNKRLLLSSNHITGTSATAGDLVSFQDIGSGVIELRRLAKGAAGQSPVVNAGGTGYDWVTPGTGGGGGGTVTPSSVDTFTNKTLLDTGAGNQIGVHMAYTVTIYQNATNYFMRNNWTGVVTSFSNTDISPVIEAAIAAIASTGSGNDTVYGGSVFINKGAYFATSKLDLQFEIAARHGIWIIGEGEGTHIRFQPSGALTDAIGINIEAYGIWNCKLSCNSNVTNIIHAFGVHSTGISTGRRTDYGKIMHNMIEGSTNKYANTAPVLTQVGILLDGANAGIYWNRIWGNHFGGLGINIKLDGGQTTSCNIQGNTSINSEKHIVISNGSGQHFISGEFVQGDTNVGVSGIEVSGTGTNISIDAITTELHKTGAQCQAILIGANVNYLHIGNGISNVYDPTVSQDFATIRDNSTTFTNNYDQRFVANKQHYLTLESSIVKINSAVKLNLFSQQLRFYDSAFDNYIQIKTPAGVNLSADVDAEFPDMSSSGSSKFVMENATQTLTNKTINFSSNTGTNIGDSAIASHTSTKITITNKSQLNSQIAYLDATNWLTNSHVADGTLNWAKVSKSGSILDDIGDVVLTTIASQDILIRNGSSQFVNLVKGSNNTMLGVNGSGNLAYSTVADANIASHTSTKITITAKGQLNSTILYNDADNALGSHYFDITETVAPASPSAGTLRIYANSTTHELTQRDSTGTEKKFSDGSGGAGAPTNSTYLTLSNDAGLSAERVLTASTRVTITDAGANSTATLDIGSGSIVDAYIGSHTSTKITITAKGQLNSAIVYNDQANSFGDFAQTFKDNQLKINNPADTFAYTIIAAAIGANRNLTLPLLTGNDTAVTEAFNQALSNKTIDFASNTGSNIGDSAIASHTSTKITITAKGQLNSAIVYNDQANVFGDFDQSFRSTRLRVANPANTFFYNFTGAAIGANRAITLPLLLGGDTMVTEAFGQTLTNKTIVAGSNTITGIVDANISSHTSTKITITAKGQLNSSIVYTDQANVFGANNQTIPIANLLLSNNGNTGTFGVQASLTGTRVWSMPNSSTNILGHDTADTLSNKSISGSSNTLTNIGDSAIASHTSTKITITNKSQLNSAILYNDADNALGAHYVDIDEIAAPSSPAAGKLRVWADSTTHEISQKNSSGTVTKMSDGSGGSGGAPTGSQYVTLATDSTLTAERVLTPGNNLALTDGGTGGNATLDLKLAHPASAKTSNYTATLADYYIPVDTTSGGVTIFLPTAVGNRGTSFVIYKTNTSGNLVTVDPGTVSETISGQATLTFNRQYQHMRVTSDGANWIASPEVALAYDFANNIFYTSATYFQMQNVQLLVADDDGSANYFVVGGALTGPSIVCSLPSGMSSGDVFTMNDFAQTLKSKTIETPLIKGRRVTDTSKTANYTLTALDEVVRCDAASVGAFTITLPTAASVSGTVYEIKKVDTGYNIVTIATTSSQTIDGLSGWELRSPGDTLIVKSDGSNWYVLSFKPAELMASRRTGTTGPDTYYIAGQENAAALATAAAVAANTLYSLPFKIDRVQTIDKVGVNLTTQSAGSNVRIGIYKDLNGVPGALVADLGTASTANPTGLKEITGLTQKLQPGLYWLTAVFSSTPSISLLAAAGITAMMGVTSAAAINTAVTATFTYAALPNPHTTPTKSTATTQPALFYHFSG